MFDKFYQNLKFNSDLLKSMFSEVKSDLIGLLSLLFYI